MVLLLYTLMIWRTVKMKMPSNINDWETTEDWENIYVVGRRYTKIYNEGVAQANRGNVKEFIRILSSIADVKERHKDNLMALPEKPDHEVVAKAQMQLANFYLFGRKQTDDGSIIETRKDTRKAFHYMTLAAENGNVDAQQNLATIYETGLDPDGETIPDVSVNYKTALKWFRNAAEQGSELAAEEGKNLYEKMRQWRFHPSTSEWVGK